MRGRISKQKTREQSSRKQDSRTSDSLHEPALYPALPGMSSQTYFGFDPQRGCEGSQGIERSGVLERATCAAPHPLALDALCSAPSRRSGPVSGPAQPMTAGYLKIIASSGAGIVWQGQGKKWVHC